MLCPDGHVYGHMHVQSFTGDVVLNEQWMNIDVPKEYDY